jgi:hypothetical protein
MNRIKELDQRRAPLLKLNSFLRQSRTSHFAKKWQTLGVGLRIIKKNFHILTRQID